MPAVLRFHENQHSLWSTPGFDLFIKKFRTFSLISIFVVRKFLMSKATHQLFWEMRHFLTSFTTFRDEEYLLSRNFQDLEMWDAQFLQIQNNVVDWRYHTYQVPKQIQGISFHFQRRSSKWRSFCRTFSISLQRRKNVNWTFAIDYKYKLAKKRFWVRLIVVKKSVIDPFSNFSLRPDLQIVAKFFSEM